MRTKRKSAALAFVLAIALALPMLGGVAFAETGGMGLISIETLDDTGGQTVSESLVRSEGIANIVAIKQATFGLIFVISEEEPLASEMTTIKQYVVANSPGNSMGKTQYTYWVGPLEQTIEIGNNVDITVEFDLEELMVYIEGENSHVSFFKFTADPPDPEPATLTLNKTFSDNNDSEVTFELWLNDEMVQSGTTSGQSITFGELEPGTYEIVESGSPSGYLVSIEGGDEVTLEEGDNVTVEVTNTLITEETTPGAIRIVKIFHDESLQEVTFTLLQEEMEVAELTTSGQAVVFDNLTPGAYTLEESVAEGHYTMMIMIGEEHVDTIGVLPGVQTEVVVHNHPVDHEMTPGSITVNKTFSDGNLAEVTIELRQGETVVRSELTSGQSITFSNLTPGAYTVVESGSPAGYTVSIEGGATVELAAGETITKTVVNTLITGGGGGGGGGGDDDDDIVVTDIDEEPTPEAPIEVTETEEPEAPLEILEEIVPLADVPQTGIEDNVPLLLTMLALSLAGLALVVRRRPAGEMK